MQSKLKWRLGQNCKKCIVPLIELWNSTMTSLLRNLPDIFLWKAFLTLPKTVWFKKCICSYIIQIFLFLITPEFFAKSIQIRKERQSKSILDFFFFRCDGDFKLFNYASNHICSITFTLDLSLVTYIYYQANFSLGMQWSGN